MTLSPIQAALLGAAQQHPQRLIAPPDRLPPAPRDAIRKSLLERNHADWNREGFRRGYWM